MANQTSLCVFNIYLVFQCKQVVLVSQVMVTDTAQWFWDSAIEWSECL